MKKRARLSERDPVFEVLRGSEPASHQNAEELAHPDRAPLRAKSKGQPGPEAFAAAGAKRVSRVKMTLYLDAEDLELLESERLRLRLQGLRRQGEADLSGLVREAIRKAYGNRSSR